MGQTLPFLLCRLPPNVFRCAGLPFGLDWQDARRVRAAHPPRRARDSERPCFARNQFSSLKIARNIPGFARCFLLAVLLIDCKESIIQFLIRAKKSRPLRDTWTFECLG